MLKLKLSNVNILHTGEYDNSGDCFDRPALAENSGQSDRGVNSLRNGDTWLEEDVVLEYPGQEEEEEVRSKDETNMEEVDTEEEDDDPPTCLDALTFTVATKPTVSVRRQPRSRGGPRSHLSERISSQRTSPISRRHPPPPPPEGQAVAESGQLPMLARFLPVGVLPALLQGNAASQL